MLLYYHFQWTKLPSAEQVARTQKKLEERLRMKFIYGLCLALCIASAQASSLMGGTAPSLGSGDVNQTASSEPTGPAYLVLSEGGNKSSLVADVKANDLAYITSRHCKYGS